MLQQMPRNYAAPASVPAPASHTAVPTLSSLPLGSALYLNDEDLQQGSGCVGIAGMLNKGVLALNVPLLGTRRFMLTKTLEWNLRWGVLDHMFDDSFCIRPEFTSHPKLLEQRFRCEARRIAHVMCAGQLLIKRGWWSACQFLERVLDCVPRRGRSYSAAAVPACCSAALAAL